MDPCAKFHEAMGLPEFRELFPEIRLTHLRDCALQFEGELAFRAAKEGFHKIEESYIIRGIVRKGFPGIEAEVFEIGGRIPRDYHKFKSGRLCLGSPVRIQKEMAEQPTLLGLVQRLIIPYLYNHSYQERFGVFPVGELDHGAAGLVADYEKLFRLKGSKQCLEALQLLGMKKRIANKRPCPCRSGLRLGRCHNRHLNPLRMIASRKYFREQAIDLAKELNA